MTWDHERLLAFATWPASLLILWVALCRLNAMGKNVLFRVTFEYSVYVAVAFAVPLAPLIDEWPGLVMVLVQYAIGIILLCQWKAWEHDQPPADATGPAPLGEH